MFRRYFFKVTDHIEWKAMCFYHDVFTPGSAQKRHKRANRKRKLFCVKSDHVCSGIIRNDFLGHVIENCSSA